MFQRRIPRSKISTVREYIWPSMGWRRTMIYIRHRLVRVSDTAYTGAAGFACGAAVSFTPFLGFHFLIGGLLCYILNASILAGIIGTLIGNPWTFPFIWWFIYELGIFIINMFGGTSLVNLPDHLTLNTLFDNLLGLLLPMSIGGVITAIIAWPLFYFPMYYLIRSAQIARRKRILKKVHKMAEKMTAVDEKAKRKKEKDMIKAQEGISDAETRD